MRRLACTLALLSLAACGGGGEKNQQQQPMGTFASCVPAGGGASTTCFAFPLTSGQSADAVCAAGSEDDETWVSVSACPSDSLVGCCGMNNTWQCFYGSAGSAESACTGDEGMWITKAP